MKRRARVLRPIVASAVLVALMATGTTASASDGEPAASTDRTYVDPAAAAAMADQQRISVAEATRRLEQQQGLGERGSRIEQSLGVRTGGSYLDGDGELVVTTLDAAADAAVAREGARAQRVDDSAARLEGITQQLEEEATRNGAGGIQGWYVDVATNTVVVTATAGANDERTAAMKRLAERFGASVRVEHRPAEEAPQTTEFMVGGYEFQAPGVSACSVGFNTLDSINRNVVLTAGHCVRTTGTVSRNGYAIGAVRTANFPGDDYGTFFNSYPGYWTPSTSVSKYNGTFVTVRGQWNTPPQGATVCKSGRTTGYTCGTITGLNQTVTYTGGFVVSGLVRHNACVEGGDSGGSNISASAYALGVTSGASMTTTGKCLSKVGGANVSYYQPIGEALYANGLRLVYQA